LKDDNKELENLEALKTDCEKLSEEYQKRKEKFLMPQKIVIKNEEDNKQPEIDPLKEVYEKNTEESEEKSEDSTKDEPTINKEIADKLLNAVEAANGQNDDEEEEDPDEYLRKLEEGH
jgi:hypothetical protein